MIKNKLKITACLTAVLIAANAIGFSMHLEKADAEPTVNELEQQKAENDQKIAELKEQIEQAKKDYEALVSDENKKMEYQEKLSEKILVQNQNISYVVEEMNQIDADIQDTISNIEVIETNIKTQNVLIESNMEQYKQRLRASYMSGDDTLSSVLAGSTSFFDILSKLEIVSKVAEHDHNLIDKLQKQLLELKKLNEELLAKQQELSENLEEATEKKNELDAKLDELNADYEETQNELNSLNSEKIEVQENIEESNEIIELKQKEQEKIDADIAAIREKIRQESIAESKRVSESIAQSIAESQRAEEEAKKNTTKAPAAPAVTEAPSNPAPPSTQPPSNNDTVPSTPSVETTEPAAPPADNSSLMYWPVPGFTRLSSDFWDGRNHGAIDIQGHAGPNGYISISGAKVYACDSGYVAASVSTCTHQWCRCGGGYGNYVALSHSDGVYDTYYAHLQAVFVSTGQYVKKGQLIGLAGTTGQSSGPHLHFEVRKNGVKTNPMDYEYQNKY